MFAVADGVFEVRVVNIVSLALLIHVLFLSLLQALQETPIGSGVYWGRHLSFHGKARGITPIIVLGNAHAEYNMTEVFRGAVKTARMVFVKRCAEVHAYTTKSFAQIAAGHHTC